MAVGLQLHDDGLAVDGCGHTLKFFDGEMEEAHDKEPDCQAVCHEHAVFGKLWVGEIAVETAEQVVDAVVDVCAGFAAGDAVIERAVFAPFAADSVEFVF